MKTLQEQYNLLNEGKGHKNVFMKSARSLFPNLFNNFTNYSTAIKVLKDKNIISEAVGGVVTGGNTSPNWFKVFDKNMEVISEEEAKAIEKKTTKAVSDLETAGYDYKDPKNSNNLNFEEMLRGYYQVLAQQLSNHLSLKTVVARNNRTKAISRQSITTVG